MNHLLLWRLVLAELKSWQPSQKLGLPVEGGGFEMPGGAGRGVTHETMVKRERARRKGETAPFES